jgi:multiple sugar transport system permease protein
MKDNSYENIAFLYNISTYFNSVWLSLVTTVIQVISTAIAGYAFARLKFKGSGLIFLLAVLTLIVPSESLATARKLVFFNIPFFGIELLKNSFAIYYMSAFGMGLRSGIFIYLFRQFFRGIPIELEESAEIDGAGVIRTFWSVMLPNARGAIVTVALFSFVWQYNDLYWAQMFEYHDSNVMPLLTTGLASSADTFNSLISTSFQSLVAELGDGIAHNAQFYGLILNTAALLMMLPLIIGYLFVQRLFVESIERTGITGM